MNDLHGALVALADRGTVAGSQLLRERVAVDLAAGKGRRWIAAPSRGLRLAIAAAVAVIAVLGGAVLFTELTSDDTTVVTEPPPVTTVPPPVTTVPEPDAAPIPGFSPGGWGRAGRDVMQEVVGTFDMAVVGDRFVVIGFDPGENFRQDGVILISTDGQTWARPAVDDPSLTLGAVLMYGVTEGGPGIVAVGMGCENEEEGCGPYFTAWTSADGTSWTRSAYVPEVVGDVETQSSAGFAATTTPDGLIVAAGNMEDWVITDEGDVESITARPVVWTSTDGVDWERSWEGEGMELTLDQYFEAGATMQSIAVGNDGLLVGVGQSTDDGVGVAAIWTSTDGTSWERVPHDPALFAGPDGQQARISDVAASDDGFVAVGAAGTHPAAWASADGLSWARAQAPDDEFPGSFSTVTAIDGGWLAAGPHGFADMNEELVAVTLWTSPDGLTWDRVWVLDFGYAMSVAATSQGIVVAGGLLEDNDFHAGVWTGPVFDPQNPPARPELPEPPVEETPMSGLGTDATCDDLVAGFTYRAALAYWGGRGRPADLDPDGNGVPCEDTYPAADVEFLLGGADALDVELTVSFEVVGDYTFEATGPAVDAGLMCSAGSIENQSDFLPVDPAASWHWEYGLVCDDGSGTIVIANDRFEIEGADPDGPIEDLVWEVESGTGAYQLLAGAGLMQHIEAEEAEVFTGRLFPLAGETLYADGTVGCTGADDLANPVGVVALRPVSDGVAFRVVLDGAAADWDYYVELAQPATGDECIGEIQGFFEFFTDEAGGGTHSGVYFAAPGTYQLLVDVVSNQEVPPDPTHREIATSGFIEITVP